MTSPSGGTQYQQDVGAPGGPHGPKITSVFDFSAEALEQLAFWLEQRGLHIPIAQIIGFSQFTARVAPTIATTETTSSSSYGDLATAGPTITGLSDGTYLLLYGASASSSIAAGECIISPMLNTTEASDNDLAVMSGTAQGALVGFTTATLSNGSNSVKLRYRTGATASTASFRYRRLLALRVSN